MGNSFELILDPQIPELELGSSPEQTSINQPKNIHRRREKKEAREGENHGIKTESKRVLNLKAICQ